MLHAQPWVGRLIGKRYRIQGCLYQEANYAWFTAVESGPGRAVCVKIFPVGLWEAQGGITALAQAAKSWADLDSSYVNPIEDCGASPADEAFYVVTRPLAGSGLRALLHQEGTIPLSHVVALSRDLASALDVLHAAGIVHGDVCPANVRVRYPDPQRPVALLLDGLSPDPGAITHRAPEGPIDPRSDLYSLGVILYEMSLGTLLDDDAAGEMASPRAVPPELEEVISRCLAPEPADRYATAAELGDALAALAPVLAPPEVVSLLDHPDGPDVSGPEIPASHRGGYVDVEAEARRRHLVVSICSALGRAFRNFVIYPTNNPMLGHAADELLSGLRAFFAEQERLDLWVDRFALRYRQSVVYEDVDVRGSFPFRLHTDGIRKLSFCSGLTKAEMLDYLGCLHRAWMPGNPTFDLVTLMWEHRFTHIIHQMADEVVAATPTDLGSLLHGGEGGGSDGPWHGVERTGRIPADPSFSRREVVPLESHLTRTERKCLAEMARVEAEDDDLWHFIITLMAALKLCAGTPDQDTIVRMLRMAVHSLLARRDYFRVAQILMLTRQMIAKAPPDDVRISLNELVDLISEPTNVDDMIDVLGSTRDPMEVRRVSRLLSQLGSGAIKAMIMGLDSVPSDRVPALQQALLAQCKKRPWHLAPGIRSGSAVVARATIRVVREIEGDRATQSLQEALGHDSGDVRADAIAALAARGDARLPASLVQLLRDPESVVRVAAIDACALIDAEESERLLLALVADPTLQSQPREEQTRVFKVLAQLGTDGVVAALGELARDDQRGGLADRLRAAVSIVLHTAEKDAYPELAIRALLEIDRPAAREVVDHVAEHGSPARKRLVVRARELRAGGDS